jgi:choline dehydrogenase-like flavoprotein
MSVSGCDDAALDRPADVAVIGSGPCGLMTALSLADAGVDVLLIESGPDGIDASAQALGDAEIANPLAHADMALATRRGFGGTSRLWGGRAVAFDAVDFRRWPIGADDIEPWYATACAFLDCGPPVFEEAWPDGTAATDGLRLDRLERWCAQPDMRRVHGDRVAAHPRIRLALGTSVAAVEFDGGGVTGLRVHRGGRVRTLSARAYVVAAGGVETARLLLASRAERPASFGGPDGPLGRYYMGHLFGSIADIQFLRPGDDARFDFHKDASGRYVRRRFMLDDEAQTRLGLMNMAAWPELPELYDPAHRSGILSLAYLALATPVLGKRLMAEAIRRRKLGEGPARIGAHVWNVLRGAPGAAAFAGRFMTARYGSKVRLPGFFVRNAGHRYAFHYHAEQAPQAENRITLSDARDALGMPRARIHLAFGNDDAASIVATHDAMDERMRRAGIARIDHRVPEGDRASAVLAQASDGFHQIGTARMSDDPRGGVVDRDARAHGVANLFLAGSAILPSSGQANPTLLAVALAARLAEHLKGEIARLPG